jgi:hypothetical protein
MSTTTMPALPQYQKPLISPYSLHTPAFGILLGILCMFPSLLTVTFMAAHTNNPLPVTSSHKSLFHRSHPINAADCFFTPQVLDELHSQEAGISTLFWNQTLDQVSTAVGHAGGIHSMPVWRIGDQKTLLYYGIASSSSIRNVSVQLGLDSPNTLVNIILPTGVAKLNQVLSTKNTTEMFGIALKDPKVPLVLDDYAYTNMANLKAGTVAWRKGFNSAVNKDIVPPVTFMASQGMSAVQNVRLVMEWIK